MATYLIQKIQEDGIQKYKISDDIVSTIFLAWSPWSWKTEWISGYEQSENYIILDTDEYRKKFEGYTGDNAKDYQRYASRVMDKMYSFCMKNDLNVIVDGTFWNQKIIQQNIEQCVKRNRWFLVVLVLQSPIISYMYTKKRELEKTRNVPTQVFIDKFFTSIENVEYIIENYNRYGLIFLTYKDYDKEQVKTQYIKNKKQLDFFTEMWYNEKEEICKFIHTIDKDVDSYGKKALDLLLNIFQPWK